MQQKQQMQQIQQKRQSERPSIPSVRAFCIIWNFAYLSENNAEFMKTHLLLPIILLAITCLSASAQVYLVDYCEPTESNWYTAYTTKSEKKIDLASKMIGSGFSVKTGKNGLVAQDGSGYAIFNLKSSYDKLSFIIAPLGPSQSFNSFKSNSIVTIKADGKMVFDEVIQSWHAPREVVLDINGAKELRFEIPRGATDLGFGKVRLWKSSESYTPSLSQSLPKGKLKLPEGLKPYLLPNNGTICTIGETKLDNAKNVKEATVNSQKFTSGMMFATTQQLLGNLCGYSYFWTDKNYEKLSFIVGAQDSKSSKASGWISVLADGKIIYEKLIKQGDLAERVVLDIDGANVISFQSELRDCAFLGGMNIVVADIEAYRKGDGSVPQAGLLDYSAQRLSKLPDICKMCSNIKPFSYAGVGDIKNLYFSGESSHYTFSMGGEKFNEGFILATGNNLFGDNINSYVSFDLGGQFDYISFKAGSLSKNNVLDDDFIQVYADDELVLDARIYSTWPTVYFEVPVKKCRKLTFAKPGNGKNKQLYTGIGDIILYRGKPVANDLFEHPKPDCPDEVDLIDLCGKPYLHYVGRYLSDLTNFSIEDCFMDGSTQKRYFQMPDGSKLYKGLMLESNIPLGLEDVNLTDAIYMFFLGAGSAISSSAVSAATGITAGISGIAGGMAAKHLVNSGGGQASVAAFNIFGEYQSITFTIACKSPYVDPVDEVFNGKTKVRKETFDVFADQNLVGQFEISSDMQPLTVTVPLYGATQLMFWLECGDVRSSQYVLYDMTLSKKACAPELDTNIGTSGGQGSAVSPTQGYRIESSVQRAERENKERQETEKAARKANRKNEAVKKETERVEWDLNGYSGYESVDSFLKDVSSIWKAQAEVMKKIGPAKYSLNETWLKAKDGSVYKCVSFLDDKGQKLSTTDMQSEILALIEEIKGIQFNIGLARAKLPGATLSVAGLPTLEKISHFGKYIKKGNTVLNQCSKDMEQILELKNQELEAIHYYIQNAVDVGPYRSSARNMLLLPQSSEEIPEMMQSLENYNFK